MALEHAGERTILLTWDGSRDDPAAGPAPDDIYRVDALVALVRRSGSDTTELASTFTGDASRSGFALLEAARLNGCEGCGTRPMTVATKTELVCPLLEGADLGQPAPKVENGKSGTLLIFGDAARIVTGADLSPPRLGSPVDVISSPFMDGLGNVIAGNDDVLALLDASGPPPASSVACAMALSYPAASGKIPTVTMVGPYGDGTNGATFLGPFSVPSAPFVVGGKVFATMPIGEGANASVLTPWVGCAADADCPAGDACVSRPVFGPDGAVTTEYRVCVIGGQCPDRLNPDAPCFLRARPRRLAVSSSASPQRFTHVTSTDVTDVASVDAGYGGAFNVVAALVTDSPSTEVFLYGRESFAGAYGTRTAALYLKRHRTDASGRLLPVESFVGCRPASGDGAAMQAPFECTETSEPVFSTKDPPRSILDEEKRIVTGTTSVAFVKGLGPGGSGLYVMLYGGRRPPSFLTGPAKVALPTLTASAITDELAGIYVRTAPHPWGPWSAAKTAFSPYSRLSDGYCTSMHYDTTGAVYNRRFACEPAQTARNMALARNPGLPSDLGAEYGAGIVSPFTQVTRSAAGAVAGAWIYWVMSTWNPYGVVLMRTQLGTARTGADVPADPRADAAVLSLLRQDDATPHADGGAR